jgi:hypothetical protein
MAQQVPEAGGAKLLHGGMRRAARHLDTGDCEVLPVRKVGFPLFGVMGPHA